VSDPVWIPALPGAQVSSPGPRIRGSSRRPTTVLAVVGSGLAAGVPYGLDLLAAALAAGSAAIGLVAASKRLIAPRDQRA
jgi:hypothetical protein